ncbi:MAG TPA: heme-binding protein [Methylomirabilota bacterium]|jgi:uncharacterized protein GlcG (DUF336 family)|nr:heme-binding protein [Methylomirabilota bacterium]
MALNLETAEKILAGARAKAQDINAPMSFAIVDAGGYLIALTRMDGAALLTPSIAHSKAYTAALFRRTSAEMGKLAETRPQFFGSIVNIGAVPLIAGGGGLPIRQDGEVVGAIGASGGTPDQDVECAQAGLAAVGLV